MAGSSVGSVAFFASAGYSNPEVLACRFSPTIRSHFTKDELIRVQQLAPNVFSQLVEHADLEATTLQKWVNAGGKIAKAPLLSAVCVVESAREVLRSNPVLIDVRRLRIACVCCGEMIREDVRISPEGSMDVIYISPCPHCFPDPLG